MSKQTVVLVTYGSSREHQHGESVDALRHELGMLVLETRGHRHIEEARSLLAFSGIAHGADVLFFIDSDVLFDPMDVERLAEQARVGRGIVGAPYSHRKMGTGFVGGIDPVVTEVVFGEGGQIYPATGVIGMGFTAIHRSVFERLDALAEYGVVNSVEGPMRPYFKRLVVGGYWLREDASFCHAARQVGAQTWVDSRIRVKHLGEHPFDIQDIRKAAPHEPSVRVMIRPIR